jgi:AraC-like DNA-binding protein
MVATLNYRRIELTSEVPAGWELVRIKGSSIGSWEGKAGVILIENIPINTFSIKVVRVFLRSTERIELRIYETPYCFSFCIEGQWQIIDQLQPVLIKQNQYQLFFSGDLQCIPVQVSGRMSQLLIITINSNYSSLPEERLKQPVAASALMIDNILQLTQTSYFPQPRSFHEKLIRGILKIAEEDIAKGKFPSERFTNAELEILHKVSVLIESDLQQHHSIASLAIFSGMNRQKLTTGFKSLFGQTIYGYYLSKRMDLAQTLLVQGNLPLKVVAKKAGYRNATNFSIAFKKFYKLTPAQMRRKKPD